MTQRARLSLATQLRRIPKGKHKCSGRRVEKGRKGRKREIQKVEKDGKGDGKQGGGTEVREDQVETRGMEYIEMAGRREGRKRTRTGVTKVRHEQDGLKRKQQQKREAVRRPPATSRVDHQ